MWKIDLKLQADSGKDILHNVMNTGFEYGHGVEEISEVEGVVMGEVEEIGAEGYEDCPGKAVEGILCHFK